MTRTGWPGSATRTAKPPVPPPMSRTSLEAPNTSRSDSHTTEVLAAPLRSLADMWPTLVGALPVVPDASSRAPRTAVPEPARHFDLLAVVGRPSGRTDVGIGRHPEPTAGETVVEGKRGAVRVSMGGG